MKHMLSASIGDAGLASTLESLAHLPPFRDRPPRGELDHQPLTELDNWPTALLAAKKDGSVAWPSDDPDESIRSIHVNPRARPPRVAFQYPRAFSTVAEAVALIEMLPFEVCSIGRSGDHAFEDAWVRMELDFYAFGVGHVDHGWACAFRGKGHDRLVSRRWLEFGPWQVIRRPNDLTIVQFHDIDAEPQTAAGQALPGWERMGLSRTGGFLAFPYKFRSEVHGLYVAATRTLEVVVPPGGKVEQFQMLDACAVRRRHGVHAAADGKPIEQVAYVFLDEADARAHLHELWLRELEVWVAGPDGKRRLDTTYHPTPNPPAWVAALPPV